MREWQPIESAPKADLILAVVDGVVRLVRWSKTSHVPLQGWCLADQGAEEFDLCKPTHWMPMPRYPAKSESYVLPLKTDLQKMKGMVSKDTAFLGGGMALADNEAGWFCYDAESVEDPSEDVVVPNGRWLKISGET